MDAKPTREDLMQVPYALKIIFAQLAWEILQFKTLYLHFENIEIFDLLIFIGHQFPNSGPKYPERV